MDKYLIGFSDSSFGKTPYPFGGGVIMINGSVGSYFSRTPASANSLCPTRLRMLSCMPSSRR